MLWGGAMDLVVKSRKIPLSEQFRKTAQGKVDKLSRLEPKAVRVEIEVTPARSAHPDGIKRLDATLQTPRKTFRATGDAADLEAALDQVVARLDRQLREYRKKRRDRLHGRGDRLKSAPVGRGEGSRSE
jgi:ribosomal subunit interface protein